LLPEKKIGERKRGSSVHLIGLSLAEVPVRRKNTEKWASRED